MVEDIKLAHIAPTSDAAYAIKRSGMNMVLAHIADKDDAYAELFKASNKETLLDNGAFENGVPLPVDKMIEIGRKVGADILVLPDYPFEPWAKGWLTIESDIKAYKDAGFRTMFVPQSLKGDAQGYELSIHNALHHPDIDFVGLSILGAPNAYELMPPIKVRSHILEKFNTPNNAKKFHMLGMLNSVDEILRVTYYKHLVNSWDTSAAVWYGVNGLDVSKTETKFADAVDFDRVTTFEEFHELTVSNINYMESLL